MSTEIQNTHIEIGRTVDPPPHFAPDCIPGDWQSFQVPFDLKFQDPDKVRVIVTANNQNVDPASGNPAVAGVVSAVDKTSFVLSARYSACNEGKAGFYYMAVEDLGQASPGEPVDLRLGILQPRHFLRDCTPGDWQQWYSRFSSPFPPGKEYAVLVTGCNLHVKPFYWGHHLRYHNAPAVGTSQNLNVNGFELATRPMDSGASSSP